VTTIPLPGKPEFAQADPAAGRVYDNLEDKSVVVAIDTRTHAVVAQWPVAPGEGPSGLALDAAHHRLFVGCDSVMVVLDSATGKVVGSVPVGEGVDAAAFDPGTGFAFTSNGESGTVTVVHEDSPDQFTVVQTLPTEKSARTMQVDPASHKIYLASAKFEAPAAPPAGGGRPPRPKMIPGSFKILVYGLAPGA
jgi:DNA-binding beta-propeller fold protein YncE